MLEIGSSTIQDGLIKVSKLFFNIANIINDKLTESLLKLIANYHVSHPNIFRRFRFLKDIRSFTIEGVRGHHLRSDFKTVNHIYRHALLETM